MERFQVTIEKDGRQIPVGFISGESSADASFGYAPDYLSRRDALPVSVSLPLQEEVFAPVRTRIFFEGLLPEGFTRRAVAEWMRADEDDYLAILYGLGQECLGAVRISREEAEPQAGYEALSLDEVRALAAEGLAVEGDPEIGYTETHQVIVSVGYGQGPEVAERLERNNVIVNYQATPDEEGFTASGALRMGVSEMTRFGFGEAEFGKLAELMADCILRGEEIGERVAELRAGYQTQRFCFTDEEIGEALALLREKLH